MDYETKIIVKKDRRENREEIDKKKKNTCVDILHKTKDPSLIQGVFELLTQEFNLADRKRT